jgi:hypothetical protein
MTLQPGAFLDALRGEKRKFEEPRRLLALVDQAANDAMEMG